MHKHSILNKALVIDPSRELRDFLRFCADRFWPGLQIMSYLSAGGCPDEKLDWTGFDLVVIEHSPHTPHERGIAWLEAIRRHPASPAVVLISNELTESVRAEARRLGTAAVLKKTDLSPSRFADCLDQVFGGLAADSGSAPSEVALADSSPGAGCEAAAPGAPGIRVVWPLASAAVA